MTEKSIALNVGITIQVNQRIISIVLVWSVYGSYLRLKLSGYWICS